MSKMPMNATEAEILSDLLGKYIAAFGSRMSPIQFSVLSVVAADCKYTADYMTKNNMFVDEDGNVIVD